MLYLFILLISDVDIDVIVEVVVCIHVSVCASLPYIGFYVYVCVSSSFANYCYQLLYVLHRFLLVVRCFTLASIRVSMFRTSCCHCVFKIVHWLFKVVCRSLYVVVSTCCVGRSASYICFSDEI